MNRLFPLAAALLLLAACSRPTDVAVQFHEALNAGNGAKAFALLSKPTQDKLTEISKKAHDASGGTVSEDAALMIAHGDPSIYPTPTPAQPKAVRATMISTDGPRAKVSVHIGEAAHEMDLVKENGRWRIDLPIGKP